MPEAWAEFTDDELGYALAEGRGHGEDLLTLTAALETKLPGTKAALRDGIITFGKARIIVSLTALLDPAEARKAEAMVLGRAGRLTPGGLRSAIAHAVKDVAPDKAKKRREEAALDARVQRWAEDSGNAALMGRELPTAEVLAADQRITAWARQLKKAGLEGDMDVLRARAYPDLLLGKDSRPRQDAPGGQGTAGGQDGAGGGPRGDGSGPAGPGGGPGPAGPDHPAGSPAAGLQVGVVPAGFAGRITLTIPLATLLGLADRSAEIPGIGPIDPDPGANTPDRYPTGHQPTAGIQHINVPDRCLRRVGNWCASRPLTCGSNRLIDDRQVRAYVGGLPVFAVDRIRVRAPMSADERQSADALGRLEAVSLYE